MAFQTYSSVESVHLLLISDNGKWSDKAAEMGIPKGQIEPHPEAAVVDMDNDGMTTSGWRQARYFPEIVVLFQMGKQTDGFIYETASFLKHLGLQKRE